MVSRPFGPLSRRQFLQRTAALGATATLGMGLPERAWTRPLTLREKIGQLFIVSFTGTSPSREFMSAVEHYGFGGIILYSGNCETADQVQTMLADLQVIAPNPLLVCVDQEGGTVVRIRNGAPVFPSEAAYGAFGSPTRVYHDAALTARALRGLGVSMNLAPVVDVLSNPSSPIGTRSFGPNPHLDARLSVAAIHGYQGHGVAATAKHFVGLGRTSIDSHHALPTVQQSVAQLERSDLIPFRAAIRAGVSSILVGHIVLAALDRGRPASLSPAVIQGLLRRRLGFRGAIMTDSLLMGALPTGFEGDVVEEALAAGSDFLLLGTNGLVPLGVIEDGFQRALAAVQSGRIPESRIDQSLARIQRLKQRYPSLPPPPA